MLQEYLSYFYSQAIIGDKTMGLILLIQLILIIISCAFMDDEDIGGTAMLLSLIVTVIGIIYYLR